MKSEVRIKWSNEYENAAYLKGPSANKLILLSTVFAFLPLEPKSSQLCCTSPSFSHFSPKYPLTAIVHQTCSIYFLLLLWLGAAVEGVSL